ncbi:hypothetical protein OAS96_02535 [Candidatus Pelagibacter sp.]|nr:hypothetical protein [Candidatus Pelagibacter sp.]
MCGIAVYYDHYSQPVTSLNKKQIDENMLHWEKFYLPKISNKKLKDFFIR